MENLFFQRHRQWRKDTQRKRNATKIRLFCVVIYPVQRAERKSSFGGTFTWPCEDFTHQQKGYSQDNAGGHARAIVLPWTGGKMAKSSVGEAVSRATVHSGKEMDPKRHLVHNSHNSHIMADCGCRKPSCFMEKWEPCDSSYILSAVESSGSWLRWTFFIIIETKI